MRKTDGIVVPHAGTWIEIEYINEKVEYIKKSFPTRERGLKFRKRMPEIVKNLVVPHAGTWIEIKLGDFISALVTRRSPRGNVD